MREDFLHYVWKHQLFDKSVLLTTKGLPLRVDFPGELNEDSGPDFFMGRINVANIDWNGPVEIHIDGNDWFKHQHHQDANYDPVVLHVVFRNPVELLRKDGSEVPTLVLEGRIKKETILHFHGFEPLQRVLCSKHLGEFTKDIVFDAVHESSKVRIIRKSQKLLSYLPEVDFDWNELAYRALGENFGFKINQLGFRMLVEAVPYRIIKRHVEELEDLEALLLGTAGFLDHPRHQYAAELLERYSFLARKYGVRKVALHRVKWNTVRVRAGGHPTLRIAQFAKVLHSLPDLFNVLTQTASIGELREQLRIQNSGYWETHFHFGCETASENIRFGKSRVDNLIINTVIPLQAAWYRFAGRSQDFVNDMMSKIPSEDNRIIRHWRTIGVNPESALDTQGLIELYNSGCSKRKCLDCRIGKQVLSR